ncbi:MAG: hypothetical protein EOO54_26870, partial [Haliea sp.]
MPDQKSEDAIQPKSRKKTNPARRKGASEGDGKRQRDDAADTFASFDSRLPAEAFASDPGDLHHGGMELPLAVIDG